jgi:LPXTG-motif cell wall-anchored protein
MRHDRPIIILCASAFLLAAPLASPAHAHGGHTPFKNCTEAYANGHANIPSSSAHYKAALDRDNDGVGCDNPPDDFTPAPSVTPTPTRTAMPPTSSPSEPSETPASSDTPTPSETSDDLAETGGSQRTVLLFAAGLAFALTGAVIVRTVRRKRRS